jgi:predicted lactoylglutathione lyase
MSRKIFVNLPVKNLDKSVDFFKQLGFEFIPNSPTRMQPP